MIKSGTLLMTTTIINNAYCYRRPIPTQQLDFEKPSYNPYLDSAQQVAFEPQQQWVNPQSQEYSQNDYDYPLIQSSYPYDSNYYANQQPLCDSLNGCKQEVLQNGSRDILQKALIQNQKINWDILHKLTIIYPLNPTKEDRTSMRRRLEAFAWLLPCPACSKHFRETMRKFKPKLDSRDEFIMWGCQIHNIVNEKLGKPQFECSVESIKQKYS